LSPAVSLSFNTGSSVDAVTSAAMDGRSCPFSARRGAVVDVTPWIEVDPGAVEEGAGGTVVDWAALPLGGGVPTVVVLVVTLPCGPVSTDDGVWALPATVVLVLDPPADERPEPLLSAEDDTADRAVELSPVRLEVF
jgi:hypothetical protein